MHTLPRDFEPRQLVRRQLEQVSYTANTVHLSFDGEASITALGAFEECTSAGGLVARQSPPVAESRLMSLVGREIVAADVSEQAVLRLLFEGGATVTFFNDDPQYEAYIIRLGEREIVV